MTLKYVLQAFSPSWTSIFAVAELSHWFQFRTDWCVSLYNTLTPATLNKYFENHYFLCNVLHSQTLFPSIYPPFCYKLHRLGITFVHKYGHSCSFFMWTILTSQDPNFMCLTIHYIQSTTQYVHWSKDPAELWRADTTASKWWNTYLQLHLQNKTKGFAVFLVPIDGKKIKTWNVWMICVIVVTVQLCPSNIYTLGNLQKQASNGEKAIASLFKLLKPQIEFHNPRE